MLSPEYFRAGQQLSIFGRLEKKDSMYGIAADLSKTQLLAFFFFLFFFFSFFPFRVDFPATIAALNNAVVTAAMAVGFPFIPSLEISLLMIFYFSSELSLGLPEG